MQTKSLKKSIKNKKNKKKELNLNLLLLLILLLLVLEGHHKLSPPTGTLPDIHAIYAPSILIYFH